MKVLPTTPLWLKKAAWFSTAVAGLFVGILLCYVETLLEAPFPIAYLILAALQILSCIASGILSGSRHSNRWFVIALYAIAILLSVFLLYIFLTWIFNFQN